jgi:hypothetical protein
MSNTQFGVGVNKAFTITSNSVPSAEYHVGTDGGAIAYTSNISVTLSGVYPTITSNAQLIYIKVVPATNHAVYYINGVSNVGLTIAAAVVTITGAGTPFAAGDVYELGINASFNHWADIKAVGGDQLVADNASGATETIPVPVGGKVLAADGSYTDGDIAMAQFTRKGELKVIMSNDIQIGAVELKDADTDNRANIKAADTGRATTTLVLAVQEVGADGTVPPTGSLLTNAPFAKITDGTSNLTLGTGTVKTVPSQIHDGTTGAAVIATIQSVKEDISSIGGEVVVADHGAGTSVTKVVPIGGKYNLAAITYNDGDVAMAQMDIGGNLKTVNNGVLTLINIQDLVDSVDIASGTAYYPSSAGLLMIGYKDITIQGMISGGVTATIEASIDGSGTPDWVDITKSGLDLITYTTANASFVDTNFLLDFTELNVRAIRIKSITADITNAVQYNVRQKAF